jgi:hypothetical protein
LSIIVFLCIIIPLSTKHTRSGYVYRTRDKYNRLALIFAGLKPYRNFWKMLKAEINRIYPKLKGIRNNQAVIDFMI